MSPTGHKFTAAALGVALAAPLLAQGKAMESALCLAGAMFGARVPDWSEMARWIDGKRYSLIPHRGPTHWPGTWLAGLILSIIFLPSPFKEPAVGFFAAALLHLVMDVMTPSGIPLLHPFSKNKAFRVYKSGSFFAEAGLTVVCWVIALASLPFTSAGLSMSNFPTFSP